MKCQKTAKFILFFAKFFEKKANFLQKYLSPILLLTIRIMIGLVFLKSGLTKIANFDSTIFLFENEYNVPVISPIFAAYSATFFELSCSILLFLGFATRIAVLPLIAMTLVIQLSVIQNYEHFYWLILLSTLFIYGAGTISLDKLTKKFASKCQAI